MTKALDQGNQEALCPRGFVPYKGECYGKNVVKGVDYDENYSPVIKDVCHRLVLAKMIANQHWKTTITDVETAFLYGELDKTLFMQCPPGYSAIIKELMDEENKRMNIDEHREEIQFVLLRKSIYGLVQAARTWWQNLWKVSEKMKFIN